MPQLSVLSEKPTTLGPADSRTGIEKAGGNVVVGHGPDVRGGMRLPIDGGKQPPKRDLSIAVPENHHRSILPVTAASAGAARLATPADAAQADSGAAAGLC